MSMIHFMDNPFPDNHDGFDYAPKSFMDVQHEIQQKMSDADKASQEKKMMSMFASIFK